MDAYRRVRALSFVLSIREHYNNTVVNGSRYRTFDGAPAVGVKTPVSGGNTDGLGPRALWVRTSSNWVLRRCARALPVEYSGGFVTS